MQECEICGRRLPIKVITIWQPWASLIAYLAKIYETRTWETSYRGPIAIHAAKKSWGFPGGAPTVAMLKVFGLTIEDSLPDFPYGCIIATAELVGCHRIIQITDGGLDVYWHYGQRPLTVRTLKMSDSEHLFGDFASGHYVWEFANVKKLDKPIPAKGRQGIWNWNAPVLDDLLNEEVNKKALGSSSGESVSR